RIQEVGTASLRNFLSAVGEWFRYDMTRFNFYLMPISFHHEFEMAESTSVRSRSAQSANLLRHIRDVEQRLAATGPASTDESGYSVALRVESRFVRAASADAIPFRRSSETGAVTIHLAEDHGLGDYPLDYSGLTAALRDRYVDFVQNELYHQRRRAICADSRLCRTRLLDPGKPHGLRKQFYSLRIVTEFDRFYTRR
ncbi:MAG TPA: DUF3644 domain-containing protein, partial [Thermoanaerobaculia bacterium]|nr:DUF3644 domain-containing protein [Thermoanaerobaculia bacterium]